MYDRDKGGIPERKLERIRSAGLRIEVLNETLQAQVAKLDDDELATLERIKTKLNTGIDDEALQEAATTVGAIVW